MVKSDEAMSFPVKSVEVRVLNIQRILKKKEKKRSIHVGEYRKLTHGNNQYWIPIPSTHPCLMIAYFVLYYRVK
jgi:hypothetical protein